MKEFSEIKYLMELLKKYKGMLYDYVDQVSKTVVDENKVVIGSQFFRFVKAYEADFPKVNEAESEKMKEEIEKTMEKFRSKIIPYIYKKRPRILFKKKRIEFLYSDVIHELVENQKRLKLDVTTEQLMEISSIQQTPIGLLHGELLELENRLKNRRKLVKQRK
ncbi:MAG: hypothetical protein GF368_02045 [Candidatus Aenigmarchaeota archaeon]|nr:hypothetical protein [Candidatus Aenigmarchaeota archaeon]